MWAFLTMRASQGADTVFMKLSFFFTMRIVNALIQAKADKFAASLAVEMYKPTDS